MSNPPSGLPSFQIPFHLSPPPPIPQPNLPLVGSSVYGPPPVPFILSHEPPPAIPHQAEQRDYNFGAAGFSCRPPLFVPNPTQKQMVDKPVQSKGDLALMYATAKAARNGITMEAPPSGHRPSSSAACHSPAPQASGKTTNDIINLSPFGRVKKILDIQPPPEVSPPGPKQLNPSVAEFLPKTGERLGSTSSSADSGLEVFSESEAKKDSSQSGPEMDKQTQSNSSAEVTGPITAESEQQPPSSAISLNVNTNNPTTCASPPAVRTEKAEKPGCPSWPCESEMWSGWRQGEKTGSKDVGKTQDQGVATKDLQPAAEKPAVEGQECKSGGYGHVMGNMRHKSVQTEKSDSLPASPVCREKKQAPVHAACSRKVIDLQGEVCRLRAQLCLNELHRERFQLELDMYKWRSGLQPVTHGSASRTMTATQQQLQALLVQIKQVEIKRDHCLSVLSSGQELPEVPRFTGSLHSGDVITPECALDKSMVAADLSPTAERPSPSVFRTATTAAVHLPTGAPLPSSPVRQLFQVPSVRPPISVVNSPGNEANCKAKMERLEHGVPSPQTGGDSSSPVLYSPSRSGVGISSGSEECGVSPPVDVATISSRRALLQTPSLAGGTAAELLAGRQTEGEVATAVVTVDQSETSLADIAGRNSTSRVDGSAEEKLALTNLSADLAFSADASAAAASEENVMSVQETSSEGRDGLLSLASTEGDGSCLSEMSLGGVPDLATASSVGAVTCPASPKVSTVGVCTDLAEGSHLASARMCATGANSKTEPTVESKAVVYEGMSVSEGSVPEKTSLGAESGEAGQKVIPSDDTSMPAPAPEQSNSSLSHASDWSLESPSVESCGADAVNVEESQLEQTSAQLKDALQREKVCSDISRTNVGVDIIESHSVNGKHEQPLLEQDQLSNETEQSDIRITSITRKSVRMLQDTGDSGSGSNSESDKQDSDVDDLLKDPGVGVSVPCPGSIPLGHDDTSCTEVCSVSSLCSSETILNSQGSEHSGTESSLSGEQVIIERLSEQVLSQSLSCSDPGQRDKNTDSQDHVRFSSSKNQDALSPPHQEKERTFISSPVDVIALALSAVVEEEKIGETPVKENASDVDENDHTACEAEGMRESSPMSISDSHLDETHSVLSAKVTSRRGRKEIDMDAVESDSDDDLTVVSDEGVESTAADRTDGDEIDSVHSGTHNEFAGLGSPPAEEDAADHPSCPPQFEASADIASTPENTPLSPTPMKTGPPSKIGKDSQPDGETPSSSRPPSQESVEVISEAGGGGGDKGVSWTDREQILLRVTEKLKELYPCEAKDALWLQRTAEEQTLLFLQHLGGSTEVKSGALSTSQSCSAPSAGQQPSADRSQGVQQSFPSGAHGPMVMMNREHGVESISNDLTALGSNNQQKLTCPEKRLPTFPDLSGEDMAALLAKREQIVVQKKEAMVLQTKMLEQATAIQRNLLAFNQRSLADPTQLSADIQNQLQQYQVFLNEAETLSRRVASLDQMLRALQLTLQSQSPAASVFPVPPVPVPQPNVSCGGPRSAFQSIQRTYPNFFKPKTPPLSAVPGIVPSHPPQFQPISVSPSSDHAVAAFQTPSAPLTATSTSQSSLTRPGTDPETTGAFVRVSAGAKRPPPPLAPASCPALPLSRSQCPPPSFSAVSRLCDVTYSSTTSSSRAAVFQGGGFSVASAGGAGRTSAERVTERKSDSGQAVVSSTAGSTVCHSSSARMSERDNSISVLDSSRSCTSPILALSSVSSPLTSRSSSPPPFIALLPLKPIKTSSNRYAALSSLESAKSMKTGEKAVQSLSSTASFSTREKSTAEDKVQARGKKKTASELGMQIETSSKRRNLQSEPPTGDIGMQDGVRGGDGQLSRSRSNQDTKKRFPDRQRHRHSTPPVISGPESSYSDQGRSSQSSSSSSYDVRTSTRYSPSPSPQGGEEENWEDEFDPNPTVRGLNQTHQTQLHSTCAWSSSKAPVDSLPLKEKLARRSLPSLMSVKSTPANPESLQLKNVSSSSTAPRLAQFSFSKKLEKPSELSKQSRPNVDKGFLGQLVRSNEASNCEAQAVSCTGMGDGVDIADKTRTRTGEEDWQKVGKKGKAQNHRGKQTSGGATGLTSSDQPQKMTAYMKLCLSIEKDFPHMKQEDINAVIEEVKHMYGGHFHGKLFSEITKDIRAVILRDLPGRLRMTQQSKPVFMDMSAQGSSRKSATEKTNPLSWQQCAQTPGVSSKTSEQECSICLVEFTVRSRYPLECGHSFHKQCIDMWVKKQGERTCPLCRKMVLLHDDFPCLRKDPGASSTGKVPHLTDRDFPPLGS